MLQQKIYPTAPNIGDDARMRSLILATALALSACVSVQATETHIAPVCGADGEARPVATMYFGRNIGQTLGVSEEQWREFVDTEVTSRFGAGLTMYDAQGQWRDTDTGGLVREPTKVIMLILFNEDDDRLAIQAIADAYKSRFQQQAVAVMIERECVAFR
jgi:hypothetical protein